MNHIYYYFDESGNSGGKFWDSQQPTYIEGGWAIETSLVDKVNDVVKKLELNYSVNTKELKGKKLIKHKRGQEFILNMIHEIGQIGGLPVLHIVEKKYMVSGKVVETFLDPLYNSKVPYSDQWDLTKRQDIASIFYSANDTLLEEFADAYRSRSAAAIKQNAVKWAKYLDGHGYKELSALVHNIIPSIEKDIVSELSVYDDPSYRGIDSLNIPTWFNIFQHIEQETPAPCTIIHDKIDTFEHAYLSSFKRLKGSTSGRVLFDDRQQVFPLRLIEDLIFRDSQQDPIIRASDIIVGSASYYIEQAVAHDEMPDLVHRIGFRTLGIFLMDVIAYKYPQIGDPLHLGSVVGSPLWFGTIINSLFQSSKRV